MDWSNLGPTVRRLREENGITAEVYAAYMGWPLETYRRFEAGKLTVAQINRLPTPNLEVEAFEGETMARLQELSRKQRGG